RLHLESGGAARDLEKTVDLDGGATVSVVFELKDLPEGLWRGHVDVSAEGDELAFDDRRYLGLVVEPPTPVLLLDGDPGKAAFGSETYFLQAALRLAPEGKRYQKTPFDPKVIDASEPGRLALPGLDGVGAVVLANAGGLGEPEARRLAAFVEGGGG